jgi:branched-chain amino acid aminotransferase
MTDHMLVMNFTSENGWSAPIIKPYGPLELDPASSGMHFRSFHIGWESFEPNSKS